MRYLDTSVLLAFLVPEVGSSAAEALMTSDGRQAVILLKGWRTALRAGDGLHLAIADAHRATIFTLDHGMAKAGATLGIAVRLLKIT